MLPQIRSRPLLWIALIAWAAQLFLPVAHAAVMAQQEAGLATWCGEFSPAMTQKLAALPHDVREILQKGASQAGQHQDCVQFCGSAASGGAVPASPVLALRAAGLETSVSATVTSPVESQSLQPPVRGPPPES